MITLFDLVVSGDRRPSPFCWRTKLALRHKGLVYVAEPVGFSEKDKIAFAGSTTLPVIRDDGRGGHAVKDSWQIALWLDEAYPARPLFGSASATSFARFVNGWADTAVHGALFPLVVADIHAHARPQDQAYFRDSREKRLGRPLEAAQAAARDGGLAVLRSTLEPVRRQLAGQPFISGDAPAYPDYILAGTVLWPRTISPLRLLDPADPLNAWLDRMLDLFDGLGRKAPTASS
jgi:glutathione S-transferase